jgi:hypothetical protein
VLGLIVGGVVGFLAAAIPAVVVFALTEIANNTRRISLEMRGSDSYPRSSGRREPAP